MRPPDLLSGVSHLSSQYPLDQEEGDGRDQGGSKQVQDQAIFSHMGDGDPSASKNDRVGRGGDGHHERK